MTPFDAIRRRLAGHPSEAALLDFAEGVRSADASRVEAHLASCARCAESVNAMREMALALRGLGEVEPRRSFRLTPSMVERHHSVGARRGYPFAALAAAAAVMVFTALVGYDAATSGGERGERAPEAALQSARTFAEGTPEVAAPAMGAAEAEPTASPAAEDMAGAVPPEEARTPKPAEERDDGGRLALRVAEGVAGATAVAFLVWLALVYRRRSGAR